VHTSLIDIVISKAGNQLIKISDLNRNLNQILQKKSFDLNHEFNLILIVNFHYDLIMPNTGCVRSNFTKERRIYEHV